MKTVATFDVKYYQCLDKQGTVVDELPKFVNDKDSMLALYRTMKLLRIFDNRVLMMHRTGKMGTFAGTLGQEAVGAGAGSCLQENDVFIPYYRSQGEMLQRGVKLHEILQFWGGDERGSNFKSPLAKHDFPITVCIATQIQHAAGVAAAIKLRKQSGRAVLTGIGDGGTSEGDFYEALNVAGAWNLPLVTFINNNQWAISERNENQTSCQTFAQKAIACGFSGVQVDGNDVIAVKKVISEAMDKARKGGGPTLVECITYRLCAHTTLDDDSKYTDKTEQENAWAAEPLIRFKQFLIERKMLSEEDDIAMQKDIENEIDEEVNLWQSITPTGPEEIFNYMFAEPSQALLEQQQDALRWWGKH